MSVNLLTSYTVDYSKMSGKAKQIKAMQDIVDYLGEERFNELHTGLIEWALADGSVTTMALSFAGISGYPATAWIELIKAEVAYAKEALTTKDG